jgi:RND family efflux transporter MFP subunit
MIIPFRHLVVGTAIGMSIACGRAPADHVAGADDATPTVEVVHVVRQPLDATLSLPGELTAYETVAVYPRVTGFVQTIGVDRGSRVRAGEVIAVLDAPELVSQRAEAQSRRQAAEAQLGSARAKAEADASTYDKLRVASGTAGAVSGNELVQAQKAVDADRGAVEAAAGNVEAARQALNEMTRLEEYRNVTAPFAGIVTERNVHPGALVGPNSGAGAQPPMVRIVDASRLRVVIPVPEAYVATVTTGAAVTFTVAAYPNAPVTGTVARIAHAVDVSTRTMAVELDVRNEDGRLSPGTFCEVRWPIRRTEASLLVPAASVASTTGRTFVIRVRDGRTGWVDVKTGVTSGPLVEVFGELAAGDVVIAHATDELRDGTVVRVKDTKPGR